MKAKRVFLTLFICLVTLLSLTVTTNAYCNGDVDENEIYSTEDARITLLYAAGLETPNTIQETAADINRDGFITTDDAREILRIACDISVAPTHQYTAWIVTKEPTCTENGDATSGCYNCPEEFHKTIPATGHTPQGVTCTTSGTCNICKAIIPAKGHAYVNGVCSDCGHSTVKPMVTYNGKAIAFGDTADSIKAVLGAPSEILTDNASAIGKVTIYVYNKDYKNLGIFTFVNNKLTQFYSNNKTSSLSHGAEKYSLSNATVEYPEATEEYAAISDITIMEYVDQHATSGAYVYSYDASVGTRYTFKDMTVKTVGEKIVFHITNGMRALHGKSILTYCPIASSAAYKHSLDMGTRNYFNHYSPEGKDPGDRLTAEGIDWYGYGENIAAGYIDAYDISNGWYNSLGHRENLLTDDYEKFGVGIATVPTSTYRYYGTQLFYL